MGSYIQLPVSPMPTMKAVARNANPRFVYRANRGLSWQSILFLQPYYNLRVYVRVFAICVQIPVGHRLFPRAAPRIFLVTVCRVYYLYFYHE